MILLAPSTPGIPQIILSLAFINPSLMFEFSKKFLKTKFARPLVAVPSTYSKTYEKELFKNGFSIVIYANHLLRASYPAMLKTAKIILKNRRSKEAEKNIFPIKEILDLIT